MSSHPCTHFSLTHTHFCLRIDGTDSTTDDAQMNHMRWCLCLAAAVCAMMASAQNGLTIAGLKQQRKAPYKSEKVMVAMGDGVKLYTIVLIPDQYAGHRRACVCTYDIIIIIIIISIIIIITAGYIPHAIQRRQESARSGGVCE